MTAVAHSRYTEFEMPRRSRTEGRGGHARSEVQMMPESASDGAVGGGICCVHHPSMSTREPRPTRRR